MAYQQKLFLIYSRFLQVLQSQIAIKQISKLLLIIIIIIIVHT